MSDHFQSFHERKDIFEGDEDMSRIIFENLPKLFSKKQKFILKKLFQWKSFKIAPFLLAHEHPFSSSLCRILKNKSAPKVSRTASFDDFSIHLLYFVSFVSSDSDISITRENIFTKSHVVAIDKISNDTNLFSSEHDNIKMLVADLKEHCVTLASNTQGVE